MFNKHKAQRLVGLSIMFFLLLNFPMVKILESRQLFLGLPTLYVGMLVLWLMMIVWTIFIVERKQP